MWYAPLLSHLTKYFIKKIDGIGTSPKKKEKRQPLLKNELWLFLNQILTCFYYIRCVHLMYTLHSRGHISNWMNVCCWIKSMFVMVLWHGIHYKYLHKQWPLITWADIAKCVQKMQVANFEKRPDSSINLKATFRTFMWIWYQFSEIYVRTQLFPHSIEKAKMGPLFPNLQSPNHLTRPDIPRPLS